MSVFLTFLAAVLQATPPAGPKPATIELAPGGGISAHVQVVRAKDFQAVPFEYLGNTVVIPAEVAGRQGWMLIDTGTPHTVIDTGLAKELGLNLVPMKGDILTTGDHRLPKQRVDDVALVIPHHFSVRMPMFAIDLGYLSRHARRRIVGVIGNDLIANMMLMVLKPTGQLVLQAGGKFQFSCKGACKDRAFLTPIQVTHSNGREQVTATVGGQQLKLSVDTGADEGLSLTPAAWSRVKPADAQMFTRPSTGVSGITDKVAASRLPKLLLGRTNIEDVAVKVQPHDPTYGDGLIGMGILSRYSFVLDTKHGQLWLLPIPTDTSKLPPPVLSKPGDAASKQQ